MYRKSSVALIGVGVGLAMVAASCSSDTGTTQRGAGVYGDQSSPGYAGLPTLNSMTPAAGLGAAGGGLAGGVWTVPGMPGATGPNDQGVSVDSMPQSQVGGVRVRLTALTAGSAKAKTKAAAGGKKSKTAKSAGSGSGVRFMVRSATVASVDDAPVLFDSGDSSGCDVAGTRVACDVPAGILAAGGSYFIQSVVAGITEQRIVSIVDQSPVSGSNTVSLAGRTIHTAGGDFGLGMSFNTADQGVTAATAAVSGMRGGLPNGWSWAGLPDGIGSVSRVKVNGWQGYAEVLTINTSNAPESLGCVPSSGGSGGLSCSGLAGSVGGVGYSATVSADGSQVVVTDSSASSSWMYDRNGRPVSYEALGQSPVSLQYVADSNLFSKISFGGLEWEVFYAGDSRCEGSVPAGFVASPAGLVCGWQNPTGEWTRLYYAVPGEKPVMARLVAVPSSCKWKVAQCSWDLLEVTDIAWDDHNRLFAVRDGKHSLAVMAGALAADSDLFKDPSLLITTYEQQADGSGHQLGRIASQTNPELSAGLSRMVSTQSYQEYADVPSQWAPATRIVSSSSAPMDGSISAQKSLKAFDDYTRPIWQKVADGTVTGFVWHPVKDLQLATIGNGMASTSSYDLFGRVTDQYFGPISAFDPDGCAPNAPARDDASCAPKPQAAGQVATTHSQYDQQDHVGAGLTQVWFSSSDFSGLPAKIQVGSFTDSGLKLEPPGGGKWSVRMAGGLLLPLDSMAVSLTVSDPDVSGVLWINGVPCGIDGGDSSTCDYDNSDPVFGTDSALPLRLDLAKTSAASAGEEVTITAQIVDRDEGTTDSLTDNYLTQRAMTPTQITSSDPGPSGTVVSTTDTFYGAVFSSFPTRVASKVRNGSSPEVTEPEVASEVEYTSNGNSRITKQETANGTYTTSYWGNTETPAAVAKVDQLGELRDQPQHGLPRTVVDTTGRSLNIVYDKYGAPACRSYGERGDWSCKQANEVGRIISTTVRGDEGVPDTVTDYSYDLGTGATGSAITLTSTTKTDGQADQTQVIKSSYGGLLLEYTDAIGTHTAYGSDAMARHFDTVITPVSAAGAGTGGSFKIANHWDELGRLDTVSVNGKESAKVSYAKSDDAKTGAAAGMSTGVQYAAGVSTSYNYTNGIKDKQTWILSDGSKITDSVETSRLGRLYSADFAGVGAEYAYDPALRLTAANIGDKYYSYGYDKATNRTCSAALSTDPAGKPCDSLTGHETYTYADDKPATRIDATGASTSFAFTENGNISNDGHNKLAYDSAGLLSAADSDDGSSLRRVYDIQGRTVSQTATATPAPTQSAGPSATSPTTTVRYGYVDGSNSPPAVIYTAEGVAVPSFQLPGGLAVVGGVPYIQSISGQGELQLEPNGTQAGNKPTVTGPYGESAGTSAPTNISDIFVTIGVRTYSKVIGIFLQPDPSGFAGGPQYAKNPGDPLNTDPSGMTASDSSSKQKWLNALIRIIVPIVIMAAAIGFAVLGFKKNWAYKATVLWGSLAAGVLGASFVASACSVNGCSLKNEPSIVKWGQFIVGAILTVIAVKTAGYEYDQNSGRRRRVSSVGGPAENQDRTWNAARGRGASLDEAENRRIEEVVNKMYENNRNGMLTILEESQGNGFSNIDQQPNDVIGSMKNNGLDPNLDSSDQAANLSGPKLVKQQNLMDSFIEEEKSEAGSLLSNMDNSYYYENKSF